MYAKGKWFVLQHARCFCPFSTHRYILVNLLSTNFRAPTTSNFAIHAGHVIYFTHRVTYALKKSFLRQDIQLLEIVRK